MANLFIPGWFIMALILVESNGDDNAVGKNGELGCMQIKMCVIQDVNRHYGVDYRDEDRLSRKHSIEIFQAYVGIYCTERRLGCKPTMWDAAGCWKEGPNWQKPEKFEKVKIYWQKIEEKIAEMADRKAGER